MTEKATFAAGCFWGVEEAFRTLKGVRKTTVGYTGGRTKNPTYAKVCTHLTGHAEAVEVEFNEKDISFNDLLKVFWKIHNPTQKNRQGLDFGTQYRSAIFYHNDEQKKSATNSKALEQKNHRKKIQTEIVEATTFYPAEEYHQKYLLKRGKNTCS